MPSALPFEFVTSEVFSKKLPRTGIEQVPGTDEVEGGVCWTETADVQDSTESSIIRENVPWDKVTVRHGIGRLPGKLP